MTGPRDPGGSGGRGAGSLRELSELRDALRERERIRAEAERARRAEEARRAQAATEFRRAVADAVPLPPSGRHEAAPAPVPPHPAQTERDERDALASTLSDEIDVERLLDTDERLSYAASGVGADVVRRLRRGEWSVQRQLDLHGHRVEEARAALVAFLSTAMRDEARCVRVIHGKGLGSAGREPVLKGKVAKWLCQRDEVIAFCQARPHDGGAGALIVLLRARSRGASG